MNSIDCSENVLEELSSSIEKINDALDLLSKSYLFQLVNAIEYSDLHHAVLYSNEEMTQSLISRNCDIDACDSVGMTPLMIAIMNRNEKFIRILLDAGADATIVNYENKSALQMFCAIHYFTSITEKLFFDQLHKKFATSEETAQCLINAGCRLYQAAYMGDAKIIELMLKHGCTDDSTHPTDKTTALHIAVTLKSVDSVKLLLKYAGNISNTTNLFEEVSSSVKENLQRKAESVVVNYLLQSDAREVSKLYQFWRIYGDEKLMQILLKRHYYYVNAQDIAGNNALMMALITGEQTIIKMLLATGADITMLNHNNKSALHIVLAGHDLKIENRKLILQEFHKKFHSSEEVAQRLIDAGSDLYQATYMNDAKIIQYMLERGFSANSKHPRSGESALHSAVLRQNLDCVKLLLKYGADVNVQSIQGETPLFYLCQLDTGRNWEDVDALKMFLNSGSLLTSCTATGNFQISPVLMRGSREMIRVVLHSNIDFAAKTEYLEMNVLHYLAMNVNPGVVDEVKLHLDKFDVNVVDELGLSPLHAAVINDNVRMVELLLSKGVSPNCALNQYGYTPLYYAYTSEDFKYQWSEQRDKCVELLLRHNANPQFIATDVMNNAQITIFDAAEETDNLEKLKPVIAHLAILEGHGISITETTCSKMNSHPSLKKYFNECQKLMRTNICESVTFFKLLVDDDKKISRYSGNKKLMLKLERLSYKTNLKSYHSFYYNSLIRRFSKGIQHSRLVSGVAKVICKIFGDRLNSTSLIVCKIIDYLNDENLQQLCELYQILCNENVNLV